MSINERREDPKQKDRIRLMFNTLCIVVDYRTIRRGGEKGKESREREKGMFNVDNRLNRKRKSSPLSLTIVSEKRNNHSLFPIHIFVCHTTVILFSFKFDSI